jgi:hypothetical protein
MPLWTNLHQQTATVYLTQTGQRRDAVETSIAIFGQTVAQEAQSEDDPHMSAVIPAMGAWLSEALIQGAYMREYHTWEKDTKSYFNEQLKWNHLNNSKWTRKISHVSDVKDALAQLSITVPNEAIEVIDQMREKVNNMKHKESWSDADFVNLNEYKAATTSIKIFWCALAEQEKYNPNLG